MYLDLWCNHLFKFYFCCLVLIAFNQCTKNVNVFNSTNRFIPTCSVILFPSMLNSCGIKIIFQNKHKLIFTGKTFLRYCVFSTKETFKKIYFVDNYALIWIQIHVLIVIEVLNYCFYMNFFILLTKTDIQSSFLNGFIQLYCMSTCMFQSLSILIFLYVKRTLWTSAKFCSPSLGFWNWFSMRVKNPQ